MAKIVQPDRAQTRGLDHAVEGAAQVAGLYGMAGRGGEDQGLAAPLSGYPAQDLPFVLLNECLTGDT
jgi:hypothetical protein